MAHFLEQGDILPPLVNPLWDSSAFLSSQSTLGILLHALIGYDDRPSGMQTIFYLGALALIGLGMYLSRRSSTNVRVSAPA
jgi:high-affinity iron transporter